MKWRDECNKFGAFAKEAFLVVGTKTICRVQDDCRKSKSRVEVESVRILQHAFPSRSLAALPQCTQRKTKKITYIQYRLRVVLIALTCSIQFSCICVGKFHFFFLLFPCGVEEKEGMGAAVSSM